MRARELRVTYRTRRDLTADVGTSLNTPRLVADVVIPMLASEAVEVAVVLCFSTKHRLLCAHELSRGSLDCTIIHPREVFKAAILANSAGIVVAHNHPSGDPAPSADDLRLTARLVQAGDVVGIDVLDHVIVAGNQYYSFLEGGQLR